MTEVFNKETGEVEELEGDALTQALSSGVAEIPLDKRVSVVGPEGIQEIDPRKNLEFLRSVVSGVNEDYKFATKESVIEKRQEEQYSTPGQQALTAVEALARVGTFGISDVIQKEFGGAEDARKRRETNKALATGVEIVGDIATTLGTGGASLIAKAGGKVTAKALAKGAGKALVSPGRAVTKAGLAAEKVAEKALTKVAGQTVGKAAGLTSQAAVEGALFNVREAITQESLNNREITAESLVGAAADGLKIGAGVGGGLALFGAIGRGTASAARKAFGKAVPSAPVAREARDAVKEQLARATKAELPDEVADDVVRKVARASEDEQAIARLAKEGEAYGPQAKEALDTLATNDRARRVVYKADDTVEELSTSFKSAFDEAEDIFEGVSRNYVSKLKPESVLANIKELPTTQFLDETSDLVGSARQVLENLRDGEGALWKASNVGKKQLKFLDAYQNVLGDIQAGGVTRENAAEAFIVVDEIKRGLQGAVKSARSSPAAKNDLIQLSEDFRRFLEDESVWGQSAVAQREVNAPWSRNIAASRAVDRRIKQLEGTSELFVDKKEVSQKFAKSFIKDPSDTAVGNEFKNIARKLDNAEEFLQAAAKYGSVDGETLLRFKTAADSARATIAQASEDAAFRKQVAALSEGVDGRLAEQAQTIGGQFGQRALGASAGAVLGGVSGGPVGSILGAVAGSAAGAKAARANPFRSIGNVVAGIPVQKNKTVVDKLAEMFTPKAIEQEAARQYVLKKISTSMKKFVEVSAVSARVGTVDLAAVERDYDNFAEKVWESREDPLSAAKQVSPTDDEQAQAVVAKGIQFLNTKLPEEAVAGASLPFANGSLGNASPESKRKYMRYANAVESPMKVIESIGDGTVTSEGVEALQAVYPSIYETAKAKAVEAVQKKPPVEVRAKLASLFGIEDALRPPVPQQAAQSEQVASAPRAKQRQPIRVDSSAAQTEAQKL
jgi:hypothetical protein